MEVKVKTSGDPEKLAENLRGRVEDVEISEDVLKVEISDPELLSRTPGVESYSYDGEEHPGLKGKPTDEQAYARLESRRDAVKALIAITEGYDLRVLDTDREWDLRQLKKYDPDLKHLKFDEPKDFLGIKKSISDLEGVDKVDIEVPEDKVELIYREMLT